MSHQPNCIFEFGPYRLDAAERLLWRDGETVLLQPKVFDLLLAMVERHGHLLEKDELMRMVWPDTVVEEANLANNISILRKTLVENGQQFIETVPKRGYRFVASVREAVGRSEESDTGTQAARAGNRSEPPAGKLASTRQTWWRLFAIALFVLVVGSFYAWRGREHPTAINSIAVLPFNSLVDKNRDEALELGMAETLITRLSGLQHIIVRPVSAVRKYAGAERNPLAAGKEQQVDAVLEGHFQQAGDRIRVTARLIRVTDGTTTWAGKFDEHLTDIFAVQDGIAEQVARAVSPQLTSAERKHLAKRGTENAEAYQFYVQGLFTQSKRTGEAFRKSIEYFNRAIEKDPNFALAYAGLERAYGAFQVYGVGSYQDSFPQAKAAARKALALDESLAEAHLAMAGIHFNEWNLPESNREYQKALELNPNYSPAHQGYGRRNLLLMGRLEEALAHLKRAQELDPVSLIISSDIGTFHFFAGQYDKAIEQLQKTLELDQNFYPARRYLGRAYEMKGLLKEALAEYQKASQLNGDPLLLAHIGHVQAALGKRDEALKALDQLKKISRQRYVSAYSFAVIYVSLGERDQVFQWLEKAYQEHGMDLSHLAIEPYFADLRSTPRIANLLRRIGLAP